MQTECVSCGEKVFLYIELFKWITYGHNIGRGFFPKIHKNETSNSVKHTFQCNIVTSHKFSGHKVILCCVPLCMKKWNLKIQVTTVAHIDERKFFFPQFSHMSCHHDDTLIFISSNLQNMIVMLVFPIDSAGSQTDRQNGQFYPHIYSWSFFQ